MDREHFEGTLRAFKRRTPFQPFTISLINGDLLEIDHPDALVVRDGLGMYAGPGGIPSVFDHEGVARVIGDLAVQPDPAADRP